MPSGETALGAPEPALIVLAHSDPSHVQRLLLACSRQPVVFHVDAKVGHADYYELTNGLAANVILAPRHDTRLASWSLVRAELDCIELALERTNAQHILVLSGSDYPLVNPARLGEVLGEHPNRSWIYNRLLPFEPWNVTGFRDGGLWRFNHRFFTRNDQVRWVKNKPLFSPIRRKIPGDLEPRVSAQWKVLSRADAVSLVEVLKRRPDLVEFGRTMFTPEESFVASILASTSLFGAAALRPCLQSPWLINWPGRVSQHPDWFSLDDLEAIKDRLERMGAVPGASELPNGGVPLFARKFRSQDAASLLDALEKQLW